MAHTTYDRKTFTPEVLPKGLDKDVRTMVRYAVDLGWTVMVKGIMVRLYPPTKTRRPTISISASNKNIPYQQHLKKIDKYGSPLVKRATEAPVEEMEKAAQVVADRIKLQEENAREKEEVMVTWEDPPESGFKAVQEKRRKENEKEEAKSLADTANDGMSVVENAVVERVRQLLDEHGNTQRALAENILGIHEDKVSKSLRGVRKFTSDELMLIAEHYGVTMNWLLLGEGLPDGRAEFTLTEEEVAEADAAGRVAGATYIEKEGPMIAVHSNGKGYESETTWERHWSDGTVDFKCRAPECDRTSESRHSIRVHYRSHVNAGEVPELTPLNDLPHFEVGDTEPIYAPRGTARIKRLANVLKTLLSDGFEWDDLDNAAERIARASLEWVDEQEPTLNEAPSEAEEALVKIREIVGVGEQVERQAKHIEMLEASVKAAEENTAKAQADAEQARDTIASFRSLLEEEVTRRSG